MWFEVPPFHLMNVICLRINMLDRVELWVELHVIPPIFHP